MCPDWLYDADLVPGGAFPGKTGKTSAAQCRLCIRVVWFYDKKHKGFIIRNFIAQLEGGTGGQKAGPCSLELRMAWCFAVENYKATATVQYTQCALVENPSLHEFYTSSECTRWKFPLFWGWKKFKIELEQLERRSDVWKENQKRTRDQDHREGPRARRGRSLLNYRQRPAGRGRTNPSLPLRRNHFALSLPNFNFSARRRKNL